MNSVGPFTFKKFSGHCLFSFCSFLDFTTSLGIQRKFSVICSLLHPFSYASKWRLAMWPQHVEFDPRKKHSLKVLFMCFFSSRFFSVSALNCQVRFCLYILIVTYLQCMHHRPCRVLIAPVFSFLNPTWILSEKIIRRSRVASFFVMILLGTPSAWYSLRSCGYNQVSRQQNIPSIKV